MRTTRQNVETANRSTFRWNVRPFARLVGRRAFTLAEALIAATILAIVSASATLPFVAGVKQINEAARLELAVFLGEAMMEEILARPFFSPEEPGQTRDKFYRIIDFHGYAETPGNLRNYMNQPFAIPGFTGLWRQVSVEYISFPNQAPGDANSFVRITVYVMDGDAVLVKLTRIACRRS